MTATRRLQKELNELLASPPALISVDRKKITSNLMEWVIDIDGAPDTLYSGEKFQLRFKFSPRYPFEAPQVTFIGPHKPLHPHVFSNGHICLSILTEDWVPAFSPQAVCLSIVSMLSSCQEKKLPHNNAEYVKTARKNKPPRDGWEYDDDKV